MRTLLLLVAVSLAAGSALASDLDRAQTAPTRVPTAKVPSTLTLTPPPPVLARQGGDTIGNATLIPSIPYNDTGTTAGYADDYDVACPWTGTAPDVVYRYTAAYSQCVFIDLCGSDFDTKLYVFNSALDAVACNDDYHWGPPCGLYVSRIDGAPLMGGETYYIVIDGYGDEFGNYQLEIYEPVPCLVTCPPGAALEEEPPLQNDAPDTYNSGCGAAGEPAFLELIGDTQGQLTFCATSGWYAMNGIPSRDTDWMSAVIGPGGTIHVQLNALEATDLLQLAPTDCDDASVVQNTSAASCGFAELDITGAPGETAWIWVGPPGFDPPCFMGFPSEYEYTLTLTGLQPAVPLEAATWGGLKSMFR